MAYEFDEPDAVGGDRLNPKDCLGHLLMVWATSYIDHSPTKFTTANKLSDVIVVDVVDLDEADEAGYQGKVYRGAWWRQSRLIGSLRSRIGKGPVLAWMGQGIATMGHPPYELQSASRDSEAVKRGQAWLAAHPDFTPGQGTAPPLTYERTSTGVAVTNAPPPERQLSRLEQLAQQQAAQLQQVAGARSSTTSLPPAPPPKQSDEPPF